MNFDKLRGIMAEKRITQSALAEYLGLSVKTINAKLNGKVSFTVEEANAIVKFVGIENPAEIFFGTSVAGMQQ